MREQDHQRAPGCDRDGSQRDAHALFGVAEDTSGIRLHRSTTHATDPGTSGGAARISELGTVRVVDLHRPTLATV